MATDNLQTEKLVVHHLQRSQSERVVWLMEELGLPYQLVLHQRLPETGLAPPSIKALHPAGTAPVLEDTLADGTKICIAETGAIFEYILGLHGRHRLGITPAPTQEYADYVYWVNVVQGSLQPAMMRVMTATGLLKGMRALGPEGEKAADNSFAAKFAAGKMATHLGMMEKRLGEKKFLAGDAVTVADIMSVFSLTTMRGFGFVDLSEYGNILRYLKDIAAHPGYKRAMKRGDPELEPMIEPKYMFGFEYGGKPYFDART